MMRIQNIEFKSLSLDDLRPGLLDSFNRFQRVTRAWRTVEGERKLVDAPFIDNWDAATKNEIIAEDFHRCIHNGGRSYVLYITGKSPRLPHCCASCSAVRSSMRI
ncbi:hypothetical protein JI735_28515 [Paenibacillus sonchi]|uniref:Uncharacterized protein n=1 Tax=Paenibacillus sonchi TaxID=373687 RepID=A0A974PAX0_9BACL|nr:hypothetical protein [Paenibacillus sonchi]QQZ60406.1 hypothetical protein JI735_28515 [Paenibacillus sonchi]